MTSTLTRPSDASPDDVAPGRGPSDPGSGLSTGDHKRIGLAFVYGGVLALLASTASGVLFLLRSDAATLWTAPGSRLASIDTAAALVIGIPALWIGIATYVVPLQIGATRLALPRVHSLALWLFAVGGALAAVGYAVEPDALGSLASSVPAAAGKASSADGTELIVVGLFLVVVGMLLAAVDLVTTIAARRADGLRLTYLPLFSWSTLATATVLVLSAPVLLAGLALLFYDHHYGGVVFASGVASDRIWEHQLWIVGQPLGLLFAAASVGALCDIVATHAGRPLVGFAGARIAAVAAPMLTLLLWLGDLSILRSPFGPVATLGGVVVGAPLGLALLTWLGTLRQGPPKLHPSLLGAALFLLTVALVTAVSVAALLTDVEGAEAEHFRNGQITLLTFGLPLLALAAASSHWSPKLYGRPTPAGAAALQLLLLFGGAVLMAAPGYLMGLGADDAVVPIGIVGCVLTAAGLLAFAGGLAARNATSEADPYGGHTLEWATASPPALHNFDEIPDVRSPHPLTDAGAED
jgi:cytochrome c oxidase subunit 1